MWIKWSRYRFDIAKRILYILEALKPFIRVLFIGGIAILLWEQNSLDTPMVVTLSVVFIANIIVYFAVIRHKKYSTLKIFAYISLSLCLTIFSMLVITTGGIKSEFYLAFLFYIALLPFFQLGYPSWEQMLTGLTIVLIYNAIIVVTGLDGQLSSLLLRNFFFLFLVFVSAISGYVLTSQNTKLKTLNSELAGKNIELVEKNELVKDSLNKIQILKEKQDGDYFLTSLLIEPLSENTVKSDYVKVDFYIQEKKRFKFRKWEKEIGGDICIAHTITLYGKPYTLFLNADAMGKSIQGAGGILVMGAIFKSIVERTKASPLSQKIYPETWLINAFNEMRGVFNTFDGSMLISLVMGLVDDASGLVYYVNAEHPWTVIFRNGKALFIEHEITFRKLGTVGVEETPYVRILQLQADDVLIMGSDGRDDIALANQPEGQRKINSDETVFLKFVEQSGGDLMRLVDIIADKGEITDDLSLLRISYLKAESNIPLVDIPKVIYHAKQKAQMAVDSRNYAEAIQILETDCVLENPHPTILKNLTKLLYQTNDFDRMCHYAMQYIELMPSDSETIFLTILCQKRLGNFLKAAELGERLILRDPYKVKYFFGLADAYTHLQNFVRAWEMIEKATDLDNENEEVAELKKIIADKIEEQQKIKVQT